jgi:hypothetical protein
MRVLILLMVLVFCTSTAFAGSDYDNRFTELKSQYGAKMEGFSPQDETNDQLMDRLIVHFKKLGAKRKAQGYKPPVKRVQPKVVISEKAPEKVTQKTGYMLEFKNEFKVDW